MATRAERIASLVADLEPAIARAFIASVQDIRGEVALKAIEGALRRGDIEAAVRAVTMARGFFAPLDSALSGAWLAGGQAAALALPVIAVGGTRLAVRFDGRNPRAEAWIAEKSSRLVTEVIEDTKNGLRAYMTNGMVDGRNPRATALDIVGRINKATGRREGGLIGLTSGQMRYVENARAELSDPAQMANYFSRVRRDRRFDPIVRRAMKDGKPVSAADINRITARYSDRLLQLRGETIARTETLSALNASRVEAIEQVIDTGAIRREDVRKIWRSASDARVRDSHVAMNGESVGINERFSNGMMQPGEMGAPPEEVINCRCEVEIRVDYLTNYAAAG